MKKWDKERVESASDEEYKLGCKVRELREEGEPWWAIAKALELPGAGDSASTGKKGAGRARQAYAKAFGSHPRSFTKGKKAFNSEKNEDVAKFKATKKADRVKKVKKGKSLFKGLDDEQIEAMLVGRKITWLVNTGDKDDEPLHETAVVHPRTLKVIKYPSGKGIEFREAEENSKISGVRGMPSRYRCVRLAQIHTVR